MTRVRRLPRPCVCLHREFCGTRSNSFNLAAGATTVLVVNEVEMGGGVGCPYILGIAFAPAPNNPPAANAGPAQTVSEGALVTLNGSASTDPEGQMLMFQWTQTGGPPVVLTNANMAIATFTAPLVADGTCVALTFDLKVTDSCGAMSTASTTVNDRDTMQYKDDYTNTCVTIFLACGVPAPTTGTYCLKTAGGATFVGPVTIARQNNGFGQVSTINIQSTAADPNLFQFGIGTLRNVASGTFTAPKTSGLPTARITDTNIRDSTCACP